MPTYLLHYALSHVSFRLSELTSVAQTYGFAHAMKIIDIADLKDRKQPEASQENLTAPAARPFLAVELENEDEAWTLANRCILIKNVYELWAHGTSYASLHAMNQTPAARAKWEPYRSTPFKIHVSAIHHSFPSARAKEVFNGFGYMNYDQFKMDDPELELLCCEEYLHRPGGRTKSEGDGDFIHIWFGRLLTKGKARSLIEKFDVKKRAYYGNTSMEAEMSLLMANQAMAAPGKLVYDPFVGTGSMLYTCAHFGAMVMGSDLDGRQMRGKDPTSVGIERSASQYDVAGRVLDCLTFDVTNNPWRRGGIFDAIVTDPPCALSPVSTDDDLRLTLSCTGSKDGVRAGAKRIGSSIVGKPLNPTPRVLSNGIVAHKKPTYVPPMRAYEMSDLANDLVELALWLLKPGGRLVFFLPTVSEDYTEMDVPVRDGMQVVGNGVQDFGKWARRLITMEKTVDTTLGFGPPVFEDRAWRRKEETASSEKLPVVDRTEGSGTETEHIPAHRGFRDKYFQAFRKEEDRN